MKYESAKDFVYDLMDNEGVDFCDSYGRKWWYRNYVFSFKDIDGVCRGGLHCLHLYGTEITKEQEG